MRDCIRFAGAGRCPGILGAGDPSGDRRWAAACAIWLDPFRCTDVLPNNFYHGAYYRGQPPALYIGYAYRPFYRYTAYRRVPRTYFCVDP
jgi:hypothetical protein